MGIFLSLVALSIAFVGGLGVVLLLRSHESKPDICGVCGTALVLGAGLVSLSSFCLGFLIQGVPLRCAVTGICLGAAGYAWKRRNWALPAFPGLRRFTAPQAIVIALVAAQMGFVTWLALYRESLGWDGLFNWESKARVAFLNGGAIPLQYYTSNYDFFHRSYPPLVPLLEAWIYGFLGRMDQSTIKLIGPYLYLAVTLLLLSVANRTRQWRWSGIFVLLPFLLVPALAMGQGSASSGYVDFPLSAIYVCGVVHCAEYWRTRSMESARLLGLSAALLPFTKADGIVPLLCLAVAIVPLVVRERNWKLGAWAILPGFGVWLGWSAFLSSVGVQREADFAGFTPAIFLSHVDRAGPLLVWTLEELTALRRWSLLWPLAAAALFYLIRDREKWRWYFWTATVCLPLLLYPCVFFFSAWDPVEAHVKISLPRLFVHVASAAALMVGVVLVEVMTPGERSRSAR
jgi:hypothetical protein